MINMKEWLSPTVPQEEQDLWLPDANLDPQHIRVLMIGEAPSADPAHRFYGDAPRPADLQFILPLLTEAGAPMQGMQDILKLGIYLTTAVKRPKEEYAVPRGWIQAHLPLLEREWQAFPNLKAVMLMGDVARTAFDMLARKQTGKRAVPAGSTYKLRREQYHMGGVRVFPSYTITGGNLLIEKSKVRMIGEDLAELLTLLD